MAESITEGTLKQWQKQVGDFVEQDEEVVTIETDKVRHYIHLDTIDVLDFLLSVDRRVRERNHRGKDCRAACK